MRNFTLSRRGRALAVCGLLVALLLLGGAIARTTGRTSARGGAAITRAWPPPQQETYLGCPPEGDGGDTALNLLKNRIDAGHGQPTSLAVLVALPWPASVNRLPRAHWTPAQLATVQRQEGRPVVVQGTVLLVRHEGPESTNCHDASARDYHTWLGAAPGLPRSRALIAELTPRVVAKNPGWGSARDIVALGGARVRLFGWLMLDQEHPEQVGKTRATLWEIHPVVKIEVQRSGGWVDLQAE